MKRFYVSRDSFRKQTLILDSQEVAVGENASAIIFIQLINRSGPSVISSTSHPLLHYSKLAPLLSPSGISKDSTCCWLNPQIKSAVSLCKKIWCQVSIGSSQLFNTSIDIVPETVCTCVGISMVNGIILISMSFWDGDLQNVDMILVKFSTRSCHTWGRMAQIAWVRKIHQTSLPLVQSWPAHDVLFPPGTFLLPSSQTTAQPIHISLSFIENRDKYCLLTFSISNSISSPGHQDLHFLHPPPHQQKYVEDGVIWNCPTPSWWSANPPPAACLSMFQIWEMHHKPSMLESTHH